MSSPPASLQSETVLSRLQELHPKLIDLSLGRMHRILSALGNPQDRLPPVIHVAGTNGKGSTIAFLKSILEQAGQSVHVYTSPHLVRFHERILIAGKQISEDALVEVLNRCEAANAGEPITFFEITTAAALLAFAENAADVCLLEVGLGGRLDATNVVARPAASVITPISVDHTEFLGKTVPEIAAEKAGILKPGVPAIVGPQSDDVHRVLEETAERLGTSICVWGRDFDAYEEHGRLVYQDEAGLLDLPRPQLAGRHQIANAAVAIAALRGLKTPEVTDKALAEGLVRVSWPARLQRLTHGPLIDLAPEGADIWLDGAHNVQAARALAEAIATLDDRSPRPLYLIIAILANKDAENIISAFDGLARRVFTIGIDGHASYTPGELYDIAVGAGQSARPASSPEEAMVFASEAAFAECEPEEPPRIVICGSLYLAGEVLSENG